MVSNLMSNSEWAFFEPFLTSKCPKSGRPATDHRPVLDGIFWIARTGAPWRDLPEYFGKWSDLLPVNEAIWNRNFPIMIPFRGQGGHDG